MTTDIVIPPEAAAPARRPRARAATSGASKAKKIEMPAGDPVVTPAAETERPSFATVLVANCGWPTDAVLRERPGKRR